MHYSPSTRRRLVITIAVAIAATLLSAATALWTMPARADATRPAGSASPDVHCTPHQHPAPGFDIDVCIDERGTTDRVYSNVYVNTAGNTTDCSISVETWNRSGTGHNARIDAQDVPSTVDCTPGHKSARRVGPLTIGRSLQVHTFAQLRLGGTTVPIGDSPDVTMVTRTPAADTTFVALGDSYSAGEGTHAYLDGTDLQLRPTLTNKCHRSTKTYSLTAAREYGIPYGTPDLVACSGAVINDILGPNAEGNAGEPAQIDSITSKTRLITISIGGNDVGFADVLHTCLDPRSQGWDGDCWKRHLGEHIDGVIDAQRSQLIDLYGRIEDRARNARLIVVTYPKIFPAKVDNGRSRCYRLSSGAQICPEDLDLLNEAWTRLNAKIRDAAHASGAEVLNEENSFDGHDVFSAEPYANSIDGLGDNESFHPNAKGYDREAADLSSLLAR